MRLSNLYIYFESKNDNLFACFVLHSLPLKSSVAEESTSVSAAAAPPRRPGVEASSPTAAAARALRVRLSASAALKAAILAAAAPAAAPAPAPPPAPPPLPLPLLFTGRDRSALGRLRGCAPLERASVACLLYSSARWVSTAP